MEQKGWPDFIKRYGEDIILEGFGKFENLARKYKNDIEDLKKRAVEENIKYRAYNKLFRTDKKFDLEGHIAVVKQQAEKDAKAVAIEFGFKDKEPKIEKLTTKEKTAQAKENFTSDAKTNDNSKERALSSKQEKFIKVAKEFQENNETVAPKTQDEEREKIIAEIKAVRERNRTQDRER